MNNIGVSLQTIKERGITMRRTSRHTKKVQQLRTGLRHKQKFLLRHDTRITTHLFLLELGESSATDGTAEKIATNKFDSTLTVGTDSIVHSSTSNRWSI